MTRVIFYDIFPSKDLTIDNSAAIVEYQIMALSHEIMLPTQSAVIFGKDPSSFQAEDMALRSGVTITPEQANLYHGLREMPMNGEPLKSDQELMVEVLEKTDGPVEIFKQTYPNIFPPVSVKES